MTRILTRRHLAAAAVATLAAGVIVFGFAGEGWTAAKHKSAAKPAPGATAAAPANTPTPAADSGGVSAPDVQARQAIAIDFDTGTVLYEKNADQRMTPSSMSKMMTTYLVFKALKEGRIKLDSMLPVSEKAWRMQGSKMFVMLGTQVKVEDLVRGMVVQSGNDACVVLAEGLAGSESAFAEQENAEAQRMGLTNSHFMDASGWPNPEHYSSARDLATIARNLIKDFPEYYHYFSEIDFTYGVNDKGIPIKQGNRNPLLYKNLNVDGIKTGHTDDGGYGDTISALRNGQRVIIVLNGMASMKARGEESERLLEWAFREWGTYKLFAAGDAVDTADVWLGTAPTVKLVAKDAVAVTIPRRLRPQMKVTAVYDSPIPAPVKAGQSVGNVVVAFPGRDPINVPLVTAGGADRLGLGGRMSAAFNYLVWGSGKKVSDAK
jgi:serine-type D-Ala-D-Ala carboxypeptidase (penicillin-binding protein 5/6)